MEWEPATRREVLAAIEADWAGIDPALRVRLSAYLVDPYACSIARFDRIERVFVVAGIGRHVAYFDDVEEMFGTAEEAEGRLVGAALYGNIALTLRELERLGAEAQ